ncbi:MAG: cytidylate kinase family protein [Thermoproteales archaeon]|nr:cytidylate kinase family protein [Thermoproteales archaeon]RLE64325.1 MAG: hypothetical protein DRJ47_07995 [Thermoprotei archaeon]
MEGEPLIIIAGMLGAGCTEAALNFAKKHGLKVVNSELIIKQIVVEGRLSYSDLERITRSGEVDLEDLMESILLDHVNERRVVVEGRMAFMLLGREDVDLKVFLWAPRDFRARRIANRRKISFTEALEEIERSDEERRNFVYRRLKRDWMDADLYDMVINTSKYVNLNEVAELIEEAYKIRRKWKNDYNSTRD